MKPSSDLLWRKSSFTGSEGNCVEVAMLPMAVAVRDSKNADGPVLAFPAGAWEALISARR